MMRPNRRNSSAELFAHLSEWWMVDQQENDSHKHQSKNGNCQTELFFFSNGRVFNL